MLGLIFSAAGTVSTRAVLWLVSIGIWLMSRPGGWAVVVVAILLGLKMYPKP
jgi:hypothetical protein